MTKEDVIEVEGGVSSHCPMPFRVELKTATKSSLIFRVK